MVHLISTLRDVRDDNGGNVSRFLKTAMRDIVPYSRREYVSSELEGRKKEMSLKTFLRFGAK